MFLRLRLIRLRPKLFLHRTGDLRFAGHAQDRKAALPILDASVVPARHQIKSCSAQTNDGSAPTGFPEAVFASWGAARRHPLRRSSNGFRPKPLHKFQNGQVNERTAGCRAYSFARHRISVVCLDTYKARRLQANSLQNGAGRRRLKRIRLSEDSQARSLDTEIPATAEPFFAASFAIDSPETENSGP